MGRIKLVALLLLLTIIVILIILFFKIPGFPGSLFTKHSSQKIEQDSSQVSKIPTSDDLVQGVKDYLANQSEKTANSVTKLVSEKKEQVITQVLGANDPPVLITIPASSATDLQSSGVEIIVIDYAKSDKPSLKLKKGTKYYIQFKNFPPNACFYINDTKYGIESDKILQIEFQKSGEYKLSTNSCDLNFKEMGNFAVDD